MAFDTHFEILYGKVRQLCEMYREGKETQSDTDINDFDIQGNVRQMKNTGSCNCSVKYEYKFDQRGKKMKLTVKNSQRLIPYTYKYDVNGYIIQQTIGNKMLKPNSDHELMQDKFFYQYDSAGNRVREDYYYEQEHKYHIIYKYNYKHVLLEQEYFYGDDEKPTNKITYRYTYFDGHGNWLRRVGQVKDYGPRRRKYTNLLWFERLRIINSRI
jgi:hypothetical protein